MAERRIRMIVLDLDGTMLNDAEEISQEDAAALARAAEAGIEVVPATGRFLTAMPEAVRRLPYLRYAITINGARISDIGGERTLWRAEMSPDLALQIMHFLDTRPVFYDCYIGDWGWMERTSYERAEEFARNARQLRMIRELRTPVDDLKSLVQAKGEGVQKVQLFTLDEELRASLLRELPIRFPGAAISSSVSNNVEINDIRADKGRAMRHLADHLGIGLPSVLAFGDGLNDVVMLRWAGVGVAMGNGYEEAKAAAQFVTASCDECGVAAGIERFCFQR